ncbi:MAG: hypothetical protein WCP12_09330 [bacterium]
MKYTIILTALLLAPPAMLHAADAAEVKAPALFPGKWRQFGRGVVEQTPKTLILKEVFVASQDSFGDCEFKLRARAPEGEEQGATEGRQLRDRQCFHPRKGRVSARPKHADM